MAFWPVVQTAVGVDMAVGADIDKCCAPIRSEMLSLVNAAKRVILGRKNRAGKRQLLQGHNPTRQGLSNVFTGCVGRCNQQSGFDEMRVLRMRRPGRYRRATQAVGYQHRRSIAAKQHVFKPGNPVATQGALPVVLLHALVAVGALPTALPVVGAAVQPAGEDKDIG